MFKVMRTTATVIAIGIGTSACLFNVTDDEGNQVPVQSGGHIDLREDSADDSLTVTIKGVLPRSAEEVTGVDQINLHCADRENPFFDFPLWAFGNAFPNGGTNWEITLGDSRLHGELETLFNHCPVYAHEDPDSGETSYKTSIALSYQSDYRWNYLPALTDEDIQCTLGLIGAEFEWQAALGACLAAGDRQLGVDPLGMDPTALPYPQAIDEFFSPAEVNIVTLVISEERYASFQ